MRRTYCAFRAQQVDALLRAPRLGDVAGNLSREAARSGTEDPRTGGLDGGAVLPEGHRPDHRLAIREKATCCHESLAALKVETRPRSWVRTEPALGLVVGLGGGMLQSLALRHAHHPRPCGRRSIWAGVRHSFCAASHQRRRRIDLGTSGGVPHVAGVPRWIASALHQGCARDGGSC